LIATGTPRYSHIENIHLNTTNEKLSKGHLEVNSHTTIYLGNIEGAAFQPRDQIVVDTKSPPELRISGHSNSYLTDVSNVEIFDNLERPLYPPKDLA
jgi:hypothetical protein